MKKHTNKNWFSLKNISWWIQFNTEKELNVFVQRFVHRHEIPISLRIIQKEKRFTNGIARQAVEEDNYVIQEPYKNVTMFQHILILHPMHVFAENQKMTQTLNYYYREKQFDRNTSKNVSEKHSVKILLFFVSCDELRSSSFEVAQKLNCKLVGLV